jgi:beta-glucosidase
VIRTHLNRFHGLALALALAVAAGAGLADSGPREGSPADWPETENVPPVPGEVLRQAEVQAQQILDGLTLNQKIGQITQGEIQSVTPALIAQYCIGSVLNGGGSWPNENKHSSPQVWRNLADAYWQAGMDGCGVPPIWGIDSVHGNSNVVGATLFPHNIGLGAANDPGLMREIGSVTARETRATGQTWVFAPTVAVARDDRWGRTYESYSEDPKRVWHLARPLIEGLQGDLGECSVAATVKHWIGDGGTTGGRDQGNTEVSEQELIDVFAPPYFAGLEAGALSAMPSFSSWNGEKLHGHRYLITEILKERLGFSGVVVSDWNGIGQVTDCTITDCPQAVEAGIDLFMVPHDWFEFMVNTRRQVVDGVIPIERLDDAVRRILRNKILLGLFEDKPTESRCAVDGELGAAKHRDLARSAVRESLVLLKNNDDLLPLARDARVLVAGKSAHSIANQSGGWTLTWQGTGNSHGDFPGATSIYDGIRKVAPDADLSFNLAGVDPTEYDVVVAVIGETPYAEGLGDIRFFQTLEHAKLYPEDVQLLQALHDAGVPVVTLFVAGRPLYTNKELNLSDAFVAAWLPGSEGDGVADVLFAAENGGVNHDFSGTLSFSWPGEDCATPLNMGEDEGALFPYGYGLTYRESINLGSFDEASEDLGCGQRNDGGGEIATEPLEIFIQGGNIDPWKLRIGDASFWDGIDVDLSDPNNVSELAHVKAGPRVDSPNFQAGGIKVAFGTGDGGVGPAQFYSQYTGGGGADLLNYSNAEDSALVFDVRSATAPAGGVWVRIDCVYPCFGQLYMTPAFSAVSDGDWHELAIPLSCFAAQGTDFSTVSAPFLVFASALWEADVANVRWEPGHIANVGCDGSYQPPPAPQRERVETGRVPGLRRTGRSGPVAAAEASPLAAKSGG